MDEETDCEAQNTTILMDWQIERIKSRAIVQGYRIGALVGMLAVILWGLVISAFLGWPW